MNKSFAKYISIFAFCTILCIAQQSFAQRNLDENLLFRELAKKNIDYPRTAILSSIYGRIYTKFSVTNKGKIEDVQVFYPKMSAQIEKSIGFEAYIKKGLKKLPLLGLGYQSEYILPIAFVFFNYCETPFRHYPSNLLPSWIDTNNMTILNEIEIVGKSGRYFYPTKSNGFENAPPSQQIDK